MNGNSSEMRKQTITLTEVEFTSLNNQIKGKRIQKLRYQYKHKSNIAEVDIFQKDLKGLILVDFEFSTTEEKNNFKMPNFCLAEITQKNLLLGELLCRKKYKDITNKLEEFKYKKLLY